MPYMVQDFKSYNFLSTFKSGFILNLVKPKLFIIDLIITQS